MFDFYNFKSKIEQIPTSNVILNIILSIYAGYVIGFGTFHSLIGYTIVSLITIIVTFAIEIQ